MAFNTTHTLHPFSAAFNSHNLPLPDWQAGKKASLSSDDGHGSQYMDSSDEIGSSSDYEYAATDIVEEEDDDEDGSEEGDRVDLDQTTTTMMRRSTLNHRNEDVDDDEDRTPTSSPAQKGTSRKRSSAPADGDSPLSTTTYRARAPSDASSTGTFYSGAHLPGAAARTFSSFTHSTSPGKTLFFSSQPLTHNNLESRNAEPSKKPFVNILSRSTNGSSGAQPSASVAHRKALVRSLGADRKLGRAVSAPTNLFGNPSAPFSSNVSPFASGHNLAPNLMSSSKRKKQKHNSLYEEDEEDLGNILEDDLDYRTRHRKISKVIGDARNAKSGAIDLSGGSHVSLPGEALHELDRFTYWEFKTMEPTVLPIELYLANNQLTASGLPRELFQIANLTVLSLRANKLEEIPPAIGELKKLKSLNVSGNRLRYLPAEILELDLVDLTIANNPWQRFVEKEDVAEAEGAAISAKNEKASAPSMDVDQPEAGSTTEAAAMRRHCAPRVVNFAVPTLAELCVRKLLEPIPKPSPSSKIRTFSPSASSTLSSSSSSSSLLSAQRQFEVVARAQIYTNTPPGSTKLPCPPHLLRPFLPLMVPPPPHVRSYFARLPNPASAPSPSTSKSPAAASPFSSIATASKDGTSGNKESVLLRPGMIQHCSNPQCRRAVSQFAEERLEWRFTIAGQKIADARDSKEWVPVKWRGCMPQCLDFLDE